jgi:hypothetical protein
MQTASVIGREFTVRLLERTSEVEEPVEEYLRELKAVELIFESALSPELAFMFKHALTHDVAYTSLLVARRKALHRLVGNAVEALYASVWRNSTKRWRITTSTPRRGRRRWTICKRAGTRPWRPLLRSKALAFYDRALAILAKPGTTLPPERMIALHYARAQALSPERRLG